MFKKTNSFFNRTLHSLKSIILQASKKLSKPYKTHFSCTFCRSNSLDGEHIYSSFINIWESDDIENRIGGSVLKLEHKAKDEPKQDYQEKKPEACSSRSSSSRDCDTMEKKIKEMYMIDHTGDIEHALDVEEALHYYSLLRSPVYLNIVDKFFNDLYS
ncbi:unnamed protein product [Cochlearia groenlandica]